MLALVVYSRRFVTPDQESENGCVAFHSHCVWRQRWPIGLLLGCDLSPHSGMGLMGCGTRAAVDEPGWWARGRRGGVIVQETDLETRARYEEVI